jgi:acetylornithine deacetylase/succinyl-diaminopimelate desuccinylase-like protein
MKCVCLQYIEGIRQLLKLHTTYQPQQTIYWTFVPGEEIGGVGMDAFLDSAMYKGLPGSALALDKGLASTSNTLVLSLPPYLVISITYQTEGLSMVVGTVKDSPVYLSYTDI